MNIAKVLGAKDRKVVTVKPETPVPDVLQEMRVHGVGAIVVSRDGEHVDGIVSERHVVLGLARYGEKLLHMQAGQIMGHPVTCTPQDSVKHVMAEMTARRVRQFPVLDDGKLCAMVSIGDIVKLLVDESELETGILRDHYLATH
jgi:CBS domain-containing protein